MNQNQQSALQDVLELLHTNFSTYETAAEYQNTTNGRKTHEGDSPEKVRSKEFFLLHLNHFTGLWGHYAHLRVHYVWLSELRSSFGVLKENLSLLGNIWVKNGLLQIQWEIESVKGDWISRIEVSFNCFGVEMQKDNIGFPFSSGKPNMDIFEGERLQFRIWLTLILYHSTLPFEYLVKTILGLYEGIC